MNTIIVVGGGAAGLMASYSAAKNGAKVFLHERNHNLGRKILITGKGRCNITSDKDLQEIIRNVPGNGKFLNSALRQFSNKDLVELLKTLGVETKVERGGRVFPVTDRSKDVVDALEKAVVNAGVNIVPKSRIKSLLIRDSELKGVVNEEGEQYYSDGVIVATGGLSYPATGSTGDGYNIAMQAGHTIMRLLPSLTPMISDAKWVRDLQGLTLKNVEATLFVGAKKMDKGFGEMLFTHYGISGPIILTLSRTAAEHAGAQMVVSVNLKPALSHLQLDDRLLRDFDLYKNKLFKNSLSDLLPQKMIHVFLTLCGIDPEKQVNKISRAERQRILNLLTGLQIPVVDFREKEAIVTRGGIAVTEINPKTMESKKIGGLYFAGEVIDIDGYTGGYNLQAAFSTGFVAGNSAARAVNLSVKG